MTHHKSIFLFWRHLTVETENFKCSFKDNVWDDFFVLSLFPSISLHYTISGSTTHTFKVNSLPLEPYAFLLFNNFSCNRRFHFRTQPSHPFKRYLHAGENLLQDFLYTVFCGKINSTATFTHCRRVSSQLSNLVGK